MRRIPLHFSTRSNHAFTGFFRLCQYDRRHVPCDVRSHQGHAPVAKMLTRPARSPGRHCPQGEQRRHRLREAAARCATRPPRRFRSFLPLVSTRKYLMTLLRDGLARTAFLALHQIDCLPEAFFNFGGISHPFCTCTVPPSSHADDAATVL